MNIILNKKYFFFILFCSFILTLYVTLRIDAPNYELKYTRHTTIVNNTIDYPYKYRILNPFIAEQWVKIGSLFLSEKASFILAYAVQNMIVFLFLFFCVFRFFDHWFDVTGTVISVLILAIIIPVTFTGYDVLGDMTTAGLMALGFYLIVNNKIYYLLPVIFIGAFNELQIILLVMFYFFSSKGNYSKKDVWLNSSLMIITFLAAYLVIYSLRGGNAGQEEFIWYFTKDLSFNLANKDWVILWMVLIVPLLIFALKTIKDKPDFLKRNLATVIPLFYFIAFLFMARLREIDKALTIFLILIPLAVISIFPSNVNMKKK